MLDFCPLCVAEVYAQRCDAMRAGTSHYPLHHPTTTYYLCCKDMQFSLFAKPILINFKKVYQNGYSIFKFSLFYCISLNFRCCHVEHSRDIS